MLKKTSLLWAGTALAIIAGTFAAGVYVAQYKIFPYAIVQNLGSNLKKAAPGLFPQIPETILTHLYALETEVVPLEKFIGTRGAIESMSNGDLLIAIPHGRIARIAPERRDVLFEPKSSDEQIGVGGIYPQSSGVSHRHQGISSCRHSIKRAFAGTFPAVCLPPLF